MGIELSFIDFFRNVLLVVGVMLGGSWLLSLIRIRLGVFVLPGTQQELFRRLHGLLQEQGIKILKLDRDKAEITAYGLTKIIDVLLYELDGSRIKFVLKNVRPNEVEIDVFAFQAFATFRISYSKKEWQCYGYNVEKIRELLHSLK